MISIAHVCKLYFPAICKFVYLLVFLFTCQGLQFLGLWDGVEDMCGGLGFSEFYKGRPIETHTLLQRFWTLANDLEIIVLHYCY